MKKSLKSFLAIASVSTALVSVSSIEARALPASAYMVASAGYSQNIASMQTVLNQLGFYRSPISGVMDEETRLAVRAFQTQYRLPASGLVDVDTANRLNEVYNGWSPAAYAPTTTTTITTTTASAPAQLAAPVGYSENIKSIQQILQQLGYYNAVPDGFSGQQTRDAISGFQMANGLPQTGVVDEQTALVLNVRYEESIIGVGEQNYVAETKGSNIVQVADDAGFLNPNSLLWTAAGGAAIGGIVAAGSGGGGGSSGGGGGTGNSGNLNVAPISFAIASNDTGDTNYNGSSSQLLINNPAAGNPLLFGGLGNFNDGDLSDAVAITNANFAHARGYDGRVYNRNADGSLKNATFDDYIIVAVVDSGIDFTHDDLKNNILTTHGVTCSGGICYTGGEDIGGHGTAVAGMIAAEDNAFGTVGIAPRAKLLPISIVPLQGIITEAPMLPNEDVVAGYNYLNEKGVDVVNNSYGSPLSIVLPSAANILVNEQEGAITAGALRSILTTNFNGTTLLAEINEAVENNTILVWAAGNDLSEQPSYNSSLPYYFDGSVSTANLEGYDWSKNWLTVVSVQDDGVTLSGFSNQCGVASAYCLAAPGEVFSTKLGNAYEDTQGTSFSAPTVAGAVAVLLGAFPHLSPRTIVQILLETADDIGAAGVDDVFGHGLLNLNAATSPSDVGWTTVVNAGNFSGSSFSFASTGLNLSSAFGDAISQNNQSFIFLDKYNKDYSVALSSLVGTTKLGKTAEQRLNEFGESEFATELSVDGRMKLGFTMDKSEDGINKKQISQFGDRHDENDDATKAALQYSFQNGADKVDASFGYNVNAAKALGFSATNDIAANNLSTNDAFENPYLGLADRATSIASEYKIGKAGLKFATYSGETEREAYEFADSNEVSGYVAEMNLHDADGISLSVQSGMASEAATFLGSEAGGALELADGAQTYFAGVAASYSPTKDFSISVNYNYGVTSLDSTANSFVRDVSDVKSNSFAIGAVMDKIYSERDSFGLTVSQPLRVSSARGSITLPQDVNLDGSIAFADSNLELAPQGQELNVEAFYDMELDDLSQLSLGTMLRIEPDHAEEATEEGLLLMRYKANF